MRTLPILCLLVLGCGLEELVVGEITRGQQVELPKAAPNIIEGRVDALLTSGSVALYTGAGAALDGLSGSADNAGLFSIESPGNTGYTNLVVVASLKVAAAVPVADVAFGFIPEVARQESVLDLPRTLTLSALQPGQEVLGDRSTTITLLLLAKARATNQTLSAVPPSTARKAYTQVDALIGTDARVKAVFDMVTRLRMQVTAELPLRAFPEESGSFLVASALASAFEGPFDYSGDGAPDSDTAAFDAAVAAALGAFEFNACYPTDRIRLVLIADLRAGAIDRNCNAIDAFRWAENEPDKQVFVTGAIHEDTPRCGEAAAPCLEGAVIDAASQSLGNWTPNEVALYDDGTHGDAASGDGLWTIALDMPYFEPTAADATAVRIGYKYTFGYPGKGWTGTEEWPGNKRVLELRDLNKDRLIVRQDAFGDETTNKDKANLLSPSKHGCGSIAFPSEGPKAGCENDVFEAEVDTDGDCEADLWPAPGTAGPVTIDCPEG